jgi:class 3 adenylate cyclase/methyl-accepting chemotaxis protein
MTNKEIPPTPQLNPGLLDKIPLINLIIRLRRRLKIGPKLVIGFSLLIALMLVGYGLGFFANNNVTTKINQTTNFRAPLTLSSSQAQANWLKLVADVQGYLAFGDPQYKINYELVKEDFEANLNDIESIVNQQEDQSSPEYRELKKTLEELRYHYDDWSVLVPKLFDLRDDQLRREPALKLLIVDATPQINVIIANSTSMINSQKLRGPTLSNLSTMGTMADFQSSFYAMVAGLRGYVTTNRDSFKFEYQANLSANNQAWDNLQKISPQLSQSQLENFNKIQTARESFMALPEQMFSAAEGSHAREDLYLFRTQGTVLSYRMLYLLDSEATTQQNMLQSDLNTGRNQLANAQIISLAGAAVVLLAGLLLAWAISQDIARPILKLTGTAQKIQGGDLAAQAEIINEDEIGILGSTFNAMTSQLKNTLQSLLDYLEQVKVVMTAAAAVDEDRFDPSSLESLVVREDALGQLARVFEKMAREVRAREQRLKRQLAQLQLDIEEKQLAKSETVAVHIPMDRRQSMANNIRLPEYVHGTAVFADVSGFTALTEVLANELGLQRGAEEVIRQLNRVYTVLIDEVHRYGGSVINFSGDAITCWFDELDLSGNQRPGTSAERAAACALAMQEGMMQFSTITRPDGKSINLSIKISIANGPARRFLVGEGTSHIIDVLTGTTLATLSDTEHQANRGEVLIASTGLPELEQKFIVADWRDDKKCAVITGLMRDVIPTPWPTLPNDAISEAQAQPWMLPPVFEKVRAGKSDMLSELRQVVALFLKFGGIDYDNDVDAGAKLDLFIQWIEKVIAPHKGSIAQLTVGDKGSYLYIVFGAPVAYQDDPVQAVETALELANPGPSLSYITDIQMGLTYGQMRVGAYGGSSHRTYGAIGDNTNLAARLMQAATSALTSSTGPSRATILCNQSIYEVTKDFFEFEPLQPILVKGKSQPVAVYRPICEIQKDESSASQLPGRSVERVLRIDHLSPAEQLTLKVASVIGQTFNFDVLSAIYPEENEREQLPKYLETLITHDLIIKRSTEAQSYSFKDQLTHETAYKLMLFAQRRQLHRAIAEFLEQISSDMPPYAQLAHHWQAADDIPKAIQYLEKAGEQARELGDYEAARRFINASLALNSQS